MAPQLVRLSGHLASRRDEILESVRAAAAADSEQTTVSSLTRAQFLDHLPTVLEAFERKLRARPGGRHAAAADQDKKTEEIKHGLHRWQQGYRLSEVTHEWGHLHYCLFDELVTFAAGNPDVLPETIIAANRELIQLVHEAITESTTQYAHMQQAEAAGRARDLQLALEQLRTYEHRRAELIHQAVHDLRGDVQSMSTAAEILRESDLSDTERTESVDLLQRGTDAVRTMLAELMDLARLEAGHEQRTIKSFDAAALLTEFATVTATVATKRGLFFRTEGPESLVVEGDVTKVRRLLQNLVLNALKYTERGGVTLSWGEGTNYSWWFIVKDTGPGLAFGPGAPLADAMNQATASARESDEKSATETGDKPSVLKLPQRDTGKTRQPARQLPGEGIGLSIVKRLCELLDASVELISSEESGTSFRIVLPRRYASTPPPPPSAT